MDPNRCSHEHSDRPPGKLAALAAAVDDLATQDLDRQPDAALAQQVPELRRLLDRLEGQWLHRLATIDSRAAASADQATPAPSTASWLRNRLHLGAGAAHSAVRTARALSGGPSPRPPRRYAPASCRPPTPRCWPPAPMSSPPQTAAEAEPVLVAAARRLDPPGCDGSSPTCGRRLIPRRLTPRPSGATGGGPVAGPTLEGVVAVGGLLEPEAGQTVLAALEPLARPADAQDERSGDQRRADALTELARRALEAGQLPQTGGIRPQLT
jgi:Domain of unknown function (DUF222)